MPKFQVGDRVRCVFDSFEELGCIWQIKFRQEYIINSVHDQWVTVIGVNNQQYLEKRFELVTDTDIEPDVPVADEVLAAELRHVVLRHWELVEELRARGYRTMCTRNVVTITKTETKSL